jgi:hypothetical protein
VEVGANELPEAILIQEPGPGSQVASPVHVTGVADPTFEQSLVVRILLADGSELATVPTQIEADLEQRGPFAADVEFAVTEPQPAVIQVYSDSARDGGVTHLASTTVMLLPEGPADIRPAEPHAETIVITEPALGSTLSGGVVHVAGVGLASFEQNLVIEVLDDAGQVVGRQAVTVNAPDLGQPGTFSADVTYTVQAAGPARVLVRDPSPMFGGDVHRASVEVTLEP